jgi:hypothetical protein
MDQTGNCPKKGSASKPSIPNLFKMQYVILETKHANGWTDRYDLPIIQHDSSH